MTLNLLTSVRYLSPRLRNQFDSKKNWVNSSSHSLNSEVIHRTYFYANCGKTHCGVLLAYQKRDKLKMACENGLVYFIIGIATLASGMTIFWVGYIDHFEGGLHLVTSAGSFCLISSIILLNFDEPILKRTMASH